MLRQEGGMGACETKSGNLLGALFSGCDRIEKQINELTEELRFCLVEDKIANEVRETSPDGPAQSPIKEAAHVLEYRLSSIESRIESLKGRISYPT